MLGLTEYVHNKKVPGGPLLRVQDSSAVNDQGLLDGFEWVVEKIISLNLARS